MPPPTQAGLVRAIGRWSLAALIVNSIIGSGLFGLPGVIAGTLGKASPWAVLLAGAAVGVVMGCFGEVASQFPQAGGPYLYARVVFGRLLGIQVGWMLWLTRLTAPAANADLFVLYLGEFFPQAKAPLIRFCILTLLIGTLAMINIRGVRAGAQVSNIFTVAKLAPLFLVAIAGAFYLLAGYKISPAMPVAGGGHAWLKSILLLIFAYGGFEGAVTPMSEAKDPRRDAAFGLFVALLTCTLLYTVLQWVVVGILPNPGHSERPLSEVARVVLGHGGAALVAVGALVAVYGYLSANMLTVPRITFALAERGDFPSIFAAIHPRFRTPYFSILVFAVLTWLFAILGTFSWNVALSSLARLSCYALVCGALPVLRKRRPEASAFRLPAGRLFAGLGVFICLLLLTQVGVSSLLILLATVLVGLLNWIWVRKRPAPISTS
ncbi:MAG: amino acid permease [Terriglobales bacterium]